MAIQQSETPHLQIIARRLLLLVLTAAAAFGCSKEEGERQRLESNVASVVLRSEAGSEASFTVSSSGPWSLTTTGKEFEVVGPASGDRGETTVTVRALTANEGRLRRELGSITLQLDKGGLQTQVGVEQSMATAPQTLLMYMPWSGDLTSFFEQNLADMEQTVAAGYLGDTRLVVFFMPDERRAEFFELYHDNGQCVRLNHRTYDTAPDFTTAEGIASILEQVRQTAPAERYAMTIGSHGMAWLPVSGIYARPGSAAPREREYWEYAAEGAALTRWFGGKLDQYRTDITTLAEGITLAGMEMEYILFDDCYMSSVEVAYDLRHVTRHLIGSTCEIMAYGFPYALMGRYLVGEPDYENICESFYRFYSSYQYPYGTIGVTDCAELERLADIMKRINAGDVFDGSQLSELQVLDGYNPTRFFDLGDYVRHLCTSPTLLAEFEEQLARTVPYHRHTPEFYSMSSGAKAIRTFSGITTSDPSTSDATRTKQQTAWWQATHE